MSIEGGQVACLLVCKSPKLKKSLLAMMSLIRFRTCEPDVGMR